MTDDGSIVARAREHHVAVAADELADRLAHRPHVADADGGTARFLATAEHIAALYHHDFHRRERRLLRRWAEAGHDDEAAADVARELSGLLDGADYRPVTMAELDDALERESLIPLRLEVDLDDYAEMLIYRRGAHTREIDVPRWRGLRTDTRHLTIDERVVVHTKVHDAEHFRRRGIDPADRNLEPGLVSLKQFQNVPRADIEMLLPSTRARMRRIDQLLIGVPAFAGGIAVLATKALPTLLLIGLVAGAWIGVREEPPELDQNALVALLGGLVALGGFVVRQWNKLKSRRLEYLKVLSENLYFRTLGDGAGVLHSLLAEAENQETAEAVVAWAALLGHPDGADAATLDATAEGLVRSGTGVEVDLDIEDALAKVDRLGLTHRDGERWRPVATEEALHRLDARWDDLFRHRGGASTGGPAVGGSEADSGLAASDGGDGLIRLRQVVDRFRSRLGERRSERETTRGEAPGRSDDR